MSELSDLIKKLKDLGVAIDECTGGVKKLGDDKEGKPSSYMIPAKLLSEIVNVKSLDAVLVENEIKEVEIIPNCMKHQYKNGRCTVCGFRKV